MESTRKTPSMHWNVGLGLRTIWNISKASGIMSTYMGADSTRTIRISQGVMNNECPKQKSISPFILKDV